MSPRRKPTRRSPGDGSYRETDTGWRYRIPVGQTPSGKAVLKDFYGRTKAEAEAKADAYKAAHPHGPPTDAQKQSLYHHLARWLETVVKVQNAPSTYESYLALIDLYIVDSIGQRPIGEIKRVDVQTWVAEIAAQGKGRTAQLALAVLHAALNEAVAWEIVATNPAHLVKAPPYRRKRRKAMTLVQAQAFLQAAGGRLDLRRPIQRKDGKPMSPIPINPRLMPLYLLYVACAFRRGEPLALRWSDIDMETGAITITKSLNHRRVEGRVKTERSERTVYADEPLIVAIKAHRVAMQTEAHQEGWKPDGFVFCTERGTPISPRNLLRHFKTVLAAAGLPGTFTLHELRHTSISLMLASGGDLTDVSHTAGHSSVAITSNVYAHSYEEGQRRAVAGVSAKVRKAEGA
ncbi:MAG: tyrosine-type recombinase/integrase [Comamonadaceae bacterium]